MVEEEEAEKAAAMVGGVEEDDARSGGGLKSISMGFFSTPFSFFLSSGEVQEELFCFACGA